MIRFFYLPIFLLLSCSQSKQDDQIQIMTVTGPINTEALGLTLEHEHVVVDFTGAEKVAQPQYSLNLALDTLLPYFVQLNESGVQTLIECTPDHIGRDVLLLKAISEQSALNILTNTGYYAAADKKYIPAHTYTETADQLAERWIAEWKHGIDDTGIKPGFIKLGVGKNHLDSIEQKIVKAGALTHLATGLKIAIHTGSAKAADDEIDILKKEGVHATALIIVHAQNASSEEQMQLINKGAWVSLDGINDQPESIEKYTYFLIEIKKAGLLHKVLISQDAFWLVVQKESKKIGFERQGSQYSAILVKLVKKLKDNGFTQKDIDQILITNPANAYKIEVCKIDE